MFFSSRAIYQAHYLGYVSLGIVSTGHVHVNRNTRSKPCCEFISLQKLLLTSHKSSEGKLPLIEKRPWSNYPTCIQ